MTIIFVSYRRSDSEDVTGRIYEHLTNQFSKEWVFKDVNSIPLGVDFRESIALAIHDANVLLAIIGSDWLTARDDKGLNRLENDDDFVRIEIQSAIKQKIPVIPVLVRGAKMPSPNDLPKEIRPLAFYNAANIRSDPDFTTDIQRLSEALRNLVLPSDSKGCGQIRLDVPEIVQTGNSELVLHVPLGTAFKIAAKVLSKLGKIKKEELTQNYIIGRVRFGLQSVKVRLSLVEKSTKQTRIVIQTSGDDVWGVAARSANKRLIDMFLNIYNTGYQPDRLGVHPATLCGVVVGFVFVLLLVMKYVIPLVFL